MAGYQFAHLDGYARQGGKSGAGQVRSAKEIADEAERAPGAHSHVKEPAPPILLYGVMPSEVVAEATAWAEQAKDPRGRKLRIDGLCLAAGVFSVPENLPDELWAEYKNAMIAHLEEKHGDRLRSVVEHVDEEFRHAHFYLVPKPGESFGAVHPGVAAAREAAANGEKKGVQNRAYVEAMRRWQDEIYAVSANFGLARLGPRRRRLSRSGWHAEQRALSAHAKLIRADVKPTSPSVAPLRAIISKLDVTHSSRPFGLGVPLYTAEQLLDVAKRSADYGAGHQRQQRLDLLGAAIQHGPEIEAAEVRLAELAAQEAATAHRLIDAAKRVKEADEKARVRIEASLLKAEQAEVMAIRAESWAKQAVVAMEDRMRMVLSPILAAFAAIIRDPRAIEPKVDADTAIAALAEWRPLANEIQQVLYPMAKAAKKTSKIKQALGLGSDFNP